MPCDIHVNILSAISWGLLKQQGDSPKIAEDWVLSRNTPGLSWRKVKECWTIGEGCSERQEREVQLCGLFQLRKIGRVGLKLWQSVSQVERDHSLETSSC